MRRFVSFLLAAPLLVAQVAPGHYIVELGGPSASARRAKPAVRRVLEAQRVEILDTVSTVADALLVRAPDRDPEDLAAAPGVARVYPVYYLRRAVDRALAVHKITTAVERLGGDAGAGVKIAILDTGIDSEHRAFRDSALAMPEGYPRAGRESDLAYTTNKILVARSYTALLGDSDLPARDADGHGTAAAMIAAGVAHEGLLGPISGVASKAWLGNYKIFAAQNELTRSDVILKALDDAVADGMDIVNLSLSAPVAPRPADDILVSAVERAAAAGVLVVTSAGNLGPDPATVGSPGQAAQAITVGASWNSRIFAGSLTPKGSPPYVAIPVRYDLTEPVTGALADVAAFDGAATACQPLPEGSLSGRVALLAYGGCRFEQKLLNAQRAGAAAAVIYADTAAMEPALLAVGKARLPASIIRLAEGRELQNRLQSEPALEVTLKFALRGTTVSADELAYFSSRGPAPGGAVKPDLVAAGLQLLVATQSWEPRGGMYSASGYALAQGTSFAAPLVAGAAAVLKAARPGLTVEQYRSLLIHTASPLTAAPVQYTGAGALNLEAALRATLAVSPVSVDFTTGSSRTLTVANLGPAPASLCFSAEPAGEGPAPALPASALTLAAGASERVTVTWALAELPPGAYQGVFRLGECGGENGLRVPYWYAAPSPEAQHITLLTTGLQGAPGSALQVPLRVTDSAGLTLAIEPRVTALAGGGRVTSLKSLEPVFPGIWSLEVNLGAEAGNNVFEIEAGGLRKEVVIEGRPR